MLFVQGNAIQARLKNLLDLAPRLHGLLQRHFGLVGVGHEVIGFESRHSLLAIHIGLLGNDQRGGMLDTHANVQRAALFAIR